MLLLSLSKVTMNNKLIGLKKIIYAFIIGLILELAIFNYQHWWASDEYYRQVDLTQCFFQEENYEFIEDPKTDALAIKFEMEESKPTAIMFQTDVPVDNFSIQVRSEFEPEYYLFDDNMKNGYPKSTGVANVCIYSYDIEARDFECLFQEDIYAADEPLMINLPGKVTTDMFYVTLLGQGDNAVILDSIEFNKIPPLNISLARIMLVTLILGLLLYAKEIYRGLAGELTKRFALRAGLVLAILFAIVPLTNDATMQCNLAPDAYNTLASSLLQGKVTVFEDYAHYLDVLDDPYDFIERMEKDVLYKHDYAFYNGNYYVYFGIVPCLLFYLPFNAILGHSLNTAMLMSGLMIALTLSITYLLYNICRRFYANVTKRRFLLVLILVLFGAQLPYLSYMAMVYQIAQACAILFVVLGLALYVKAGSNECVHYKRYLLVGSLMVALAAGCRPHICLFAVLAIPLLWHKMVVKNLKSISSWAAFMVPYIIVAAGLMYYNYIRFGNVFDFGSKYNLTLDIISEYSFGFDKVLVALDYIFFRLPHLTLRFPFFEELNPQYVLDKQIKFTIGGYFATNIIMLLAFLPLAKAKCKEGAKNVLLIIQYILLGLSLAIGVIDVVMNGCLERYTIDVAVWISIATAIVLLRLLEGGVSRYVKMLILIGLAIVICTNCMLTFYADPIQLEVLNLRDFQYLSRFFMFWR